MSTFTPFLWLNGLARERDWLRERARRPVPAAAHRPADCRAGTRLCPLPFLVTATPAPTACARAALGDEPELERPAWPLAYGVDAAGVAVHRHARAVFRRKHPWHRAGIAAAGRFVAAARRWFVAWTCIAFAVAPALVWQALVVHLTLSFALSMLLAVATVWLAFCQPSPFRFVLAVICMAFSMAAIRPMSALAAG